jgi:DNA-binding response OmpR family regulator
VVANAALVAPKSLASILVVDDDAQLCQSLSQSLRERGYDASAVTSFAEALACVRERHYDVLLTDLHMDGGDGMDLILALREESPGTRPVLMSADATARESQRALDLGAVRVLFKPFESEEMFAAVERAAEYAGGFWASMHGLSLVDTLQMFHFSRRSLSVHLLGALRATLHLREGQLIHAEHGDSCGEAALATILKMPAGALQTFALEPVTQTIFKDFQGVLLDQLRQLDEKERDSKTPQTADLFEDDFAVDDFGLDRPSAESGERLAVRPPQKPKTLAKIDAACERVVNALEGAVACVVIDMKAGTVLGIHNRHGSSDAQNEIVAAATVDLFLGPNTSRFEAMVNAAPCAAAPQPLPAEHHSFEEVQLTSQHALHFAKTFGGGRAVALLMTSRNTSLGMGWAMLRSSIAIFGRLLPQ